MFYIYHKKSLLILNAGKLAFCDILLKLLHNMVRFRYSPYSTTVPLSTVYHEVVFNVFNVKYYFFFVSLKPTYLR